MFKFVHYCWSSIFVAYLNCFFGCVRSHSGPEMNVAVTILRESSISRLSLSVLHCRVHESLAHSRLPLSRHRAPQHSIVIKYLTYIVEVEILMQILWTYDVCIIIILHKYRFIEISISFMMIHQKRFFFNIRIESFL